MGSPQNTKIGAVGWAYDKSVLPSSISAFRFPTSENDRLKSICDTASKIEVTYSFFINVSHFYPHRTMTPAAYVNRRPV